MKNYILSESCEPLILFGESGRGKTAILAKLSSEVIINHSFLSLYIKILNML